MRNKVLVPIGAAVIIASTVGVAAAVSGEKPDRQPAATSQSSAATDELAGVAAGQNAAPTEETLQQPPTTATAAGSTGLLQPGARLTAGQSVVSPNRQYTLAQQADGNLVLREGPNQALWSTQTHENPGAVATFDTNGNLVVTSKDGRQLWQSATSGAGASLGVQNDGNVVIYNKAKKGIWSRQAQAIKLYPGQTLTANQWRTSANGTYRLTQYGDGNLVVTTVADKRVLWATQTHGNAGAYTRIGRDGNLVVYSKDGTPLYVTGTSSAGAAFVLNNDGNAVVLGTDGRAVWGTNTSGVSKLTKGQWLRPGQYRTSQNGQYRLEQFGDGNLVLRNAQGKAIWSSGTHGNPNARTAMQGDGNLVVHNSAGTGIWSTRTHGTTATHVQVQNDGNVVLYDAANQHLWSTRTSTS
jgi:hypothetical protein